MEVTLDLINKGVKAKDAINVRAHIFLCGPSILDYSLTKLMVSHDLLRSTVTNQIAFDQRNSKSISNFERAMDRFVTRHWSFVFSGFQIGNLEPSVLTNWLVAVKLFPDKYSPLKLAYIITCTILSKHACYFGVRNLRRASLGLWHKKRFIFLSFPIQENMDYSRLQNSKRVIHTRTFYHGLTYIIHAFTKQFYFVPISLQTLLG